MENPQKIVVTNRKTLGYGWTNVPTRNGATVGDVVGPVFFGKAADVESERKRIQRIHSGGTWYREALFVGHRKVRDHVSDVMLGLAAGGPVTVTLDD